MKNKILFILVVLICMSATSVFGALPAYMWVEGPDGLLECSVQTSGKENSIEVIEFSHEIHLPYDHETGQITGSRRISAFSTVKEFDKCSPTLYQYLCQGTQIPTIEIKWYRIGGGGLEEHYFTIFLENVRLVSIKPWMLNTDDPVNAVFGHMEEVSFLAEQMTWTWEPDGTEYTETNY